MRRAQRVTHQKPERRSCARKAGAVLVIFIRWHDAAGPVGRHQTLTADGSIGFEHRPARALHQPFKRQRTQLGIAAFVQAR